MTRTVLVVEDDTQLQVLAARVIQTCGHNAVVASNGMEARRLAAADPAPDLVLMDLALPGEDGFEVTRALKAQHPGLTVIAVSAHAMVTDRDRARAAGCSGFLTKPYQIDQLIQVIKGTLGEAATA
jgi:two-component system cell cycle response regulator DivK